MAREERNYKRKRKKKFKSKKRERMEKREEKKWTGKKGMGKIEREREKLSENEK